MESWSGDKNHKKVIIIPIGESHPEHGYVMAVIKEMMLQFEENKIEYEVGMEVPSNFTTEDMISQARIYSGFENEQFDEKQMNKIHAIDLAAIEYKNGIDARNQIVAIVKENSDKTLGGYEFTEKENEDFQKKIQGIKGNNRYGLSYINNLSPSDYEAQKELPSYYYDMFKDPEETKLVSSQERMTIRNNVMRDRVEALLGGKEVIIINCGMYHLRSEFEDKNEDKEVIDVVNLLKNNENLDVKDVIFPVRFDEKVMTKELKVVEFKGQEFVESKTPANKTEHTIPIKRFAAYNRVFGNSKEEIKENVNKYLIELGLQVEPMNKNKEDDLMGGVVYGEIKSIGLYQKSYINQYNKTENYREESHEGEGKEVETGKEWINKINNSNKGGSRGQGQ